MKEISLIPPDPRDNLRKITSYHYPGKGWFHRWVVDNSVLPARVNALMEQVDGRLTLVPYESVIFEDWSIEEKETCVRR